MKSIDVLKQAGPISKEFQCDLGDERRTKRVKQMAEALAERPGESLPVVFSDPSALEGGYRLLRNRSVEFDDLLSGHHAATRRRVSGLERVCVLHDSTEFNWSTRDAPRWGLSRLSPRRQGFFAHTSFVVSADGLRCPLGSVGMRPWVRRDGLEGNEEAEWWMQRHPFYDSEFDRWLEGVTAAESALGDVTDVIHVMDREGDAYDLLHLLTSNGCSFVIRLAQQRRVVDLETEGATTIHDSLESAPVLTERTVTISERIDAGRNPYEKRTFPARDGREARVSIRACSLGLRLPKKRSLREGLPKYIPINLVEVIELEPPERQEPVHWVLITREPVDTVEQALQVVDLYRSRWVIEEFFKAIKTGCGYRKRQLDSAATLLNALAITIPIAWRLLALRSLERHAADEPVGCIVSELQLKLLKRCAKGCKWSATPTLGEVLWAVARLGGHIRSNGRPDWQVFGRGWTELILLEAGYRLAMEDLM